MPKAASYALHSSDLTVRLLIPVRSLSPGMRGVTDRLTRYAADKILRNRVLNYTSTARRK